jgi:hypothetical protein
MRRAERSPGPAIEMVRAEENEYSTGVTSDIVNLLDQRIYSDFIFMMTLVHRATSSQ